MTLFNSNRNTKHGNFDSNRYIKRIGFYDDSKYTQFIWIRLAFKNYEPEKICFIFKKWENTNKAGNLNKITLLDPAYQMQLRSQRTGRGLIQMDDKSFSFILRTTMILPWKSGLFCHFIAPTYDLTLKRTKLQSIENSEMANQFKSIEKLYIELLIQKESNVTRRHIRSSKFR